LQVVTRVAPTHGGDATARKKAVTKIFSNQRPSSARVEQKSIFGIREPLVLIFNLLEGENRGSGAFGRAKKKNPE
jgi:hypothetical protein